MGNTQTRPGSFQVKNNHKTIVCPRTPASVIVDEFGKQGEIRTENFRSHTVVQLEESDKIRVIFSYESERYDYLSNPIEGIGTGSLSVKARKCNKFTSVDLLLEKVRINGCIITLEYAGRLEKDFCIDKGTKLKSSVTFILHSCRVVNPTVAAPAAAEAAPEAAAEEAAPEAAAEAAPAVAEAAAEAAPST